MGKCNLTPFSAEGRGLAWGVLGVALFSLTLPATRAAVAHLDPWFVASGRGLLAATVAAVVLLATRQKFPSRSQFATLALSSLGVVFGFPLFVTWAMQHVPATHGAVVLALLPLATAAAGALVAHERPSRGFWAVGLAGSLVVIAFALRQGAGELESADLALLAAIVCAALGYAIGARASATLGGWQTISWSLVICVPVLLPLTLAFAPRETNAIPASAWAGFLYLALVSQYLGFFAWYHGLALGGIARAGQAQLLQPFMTLVASALLIGEALRADEIFFAAMVVALVALGRRMPVRRA
jgi:drug/metabolite transporter (DMT)-like permease